MVTVGLGLGLVISRQTETKTGQRLSGIFQPDRDPDRRSGTPLIIKIENRWSTSRVDLCSNTGSFKNFSQRARWKNNIPAYSGAPHCSGVYLHPHPTALWHKADIWTFSFTRFLVSLLLYLETLNRLWGGIIGKVMRWTLQKKFENSVFKTIWRELNFV